MKLPWKILPFMLLTYGVYGQSLERSVLGSMGMTNESGDLQMDVTLGESVILSHDQSAFLWTGGFHQPEYKMSTSIGQNNQLQWVVFPNPTQQVMQIRGMEGSAQLRICSQSGVQMMFALIKGETSIDISSYPAGIYNITIKELLTGRSSTTNLVKI